MKLIPAILAKNKEELESMFDLLVANKNVGQVQVDFIDEEYSNITVPVALADVNKFKQFKWDAHLMLSRETIWDEISLAMISGFKRIIPQVESVDDQEKFIAMTGGFERGLALDLESGISAINIGVLGELDVVLVLAVEAGFGGQLFDNRVIEKIKELKELREQRGYKYKICVDGGVEELHLRILEEVGADEVAVGVRRMVDWKV